MDTVRLNYRVEMELARERSSRSGRSKSRRRYLSRRPDLQSVMRSRASFCPAGWSPTHGLCTSCEMANIVTRLATSSLRCSTRAASCSANYPPTRLARSSPHLRTVLSSEGTADTRSSHRPAHSGRTRELLPLVSGASAENSFAALLWPVPAQEGHFPRQP